MFDDIPYLRAARQEHDVFAGILREQGVERVTATPHYVNHRDTVPAFLERRAEAMERLKAAAQERGVSLPPLSLIHI